MSQLRPKRAQSRCAASGAQMRPTPALIARSEHSATQRAVCEALRRISTLHESLGAELSALVANLELAVAVGAEQSVHADVPETDALDELLTTKQLCELLHCHKRTLRRMELLDELPRPIRHGRLKRWRRSDIDEWLTQRGGNSR